MATITITNPSATYQGTIGGVRFVDGVATVDPATDQGKALVEFAKRKGWAYTGHAALPVLVQNGKPVARWTATEAKAYLTAQGVKFPGNASTVDLLNAVHTAYETRAQGGSAALEAAGHIMGTFPVLDAPNVNGDDEAKAALWSPPLTPPDGSNEDGAAPTVTTQPASVSKVAPATATFAVAGAGVPEPSVQWQSQPAGGAYADISGATALSYTTPPTTVAQSGTKYRAILRNPKGSAQTTEATLTVTSA